MLRFAVTLFNEPELRSLGKYFFGLMNIDVVFSPELVTISSSQMNSVTSTKGKSVTPPHRDQRFLTFALPASVPYESAYRSH